MPFSCAFKYAFCMAILQVGQEVYSGNGQGLKQVVHGISINKEKGLFYAETRIFCKLEKLD